MNTNFKAAMTMVLCWALTAGASFGLAQDLATITGGVVDPSGVKAAGANVTARNIDTNYILATKTAAEDGRYSLQGLPIGTYEVKVELAGFAAVLRRPIVLTLGQVAELPTVKLVLSAGKEVVNINEDAPLINKSTSEGGDSYKGPRLENLPNSGAGPIGAGFRDVATIGLSVPGASGLNSGDFTGPNGTDIAMNGKGIRSNITVLDGQNINDPASAGRSLPMNNPDAIEEVRVIANQLSAEHGGASGAIISVATRRGSNIPHGSLFWFNNSNALNSMSNLDKSSGLKSAPLRIENQLGGTVGSPLVPNKLFAFGSFQRWTDRNRSSGATISSAPTGAGRALLQANGGTRSTTQALLENLPAAQSVQTGVVPYCFNPAPWTGPGAPPAAAADPNNPGQFICASGWSPIAVPVGTLTNTNLIRYNDWQGSARLDYNLRKGNSVSGRYMFNDDIQIGVGQATPPGFANTIPSRSQAATIGWTSPFTATFLNEFRVSWNRFAFYTGPQKPVALNIPSIEIGELGLTGFTSVGPRSALGYPSNLPEGRRSDIYQFTNNMSWNHGAHTAKWGVDIQKQDMASESNPNVRGQLRYSTLTNFVADFADTRASLNRPLPGGQFVLHFNWTDWSFFVQDDWKVAPRLTLNVGLRYELPGNSINSLYPVNDRIVAANGGNPLFRYNSRPKRDTNNLMPRVGFNWDLGATGVGVLRKSVLRGGYARTNDYAFLIMAIQTGAGFPFQAGFNLAGTPGTMDGLANLSSQTLNPAAAPMLSQTQLSSNFHTPYSDQYSLELQRDLGVNDVLRLRYVGTKGTGLFQSLEGNPVTRCGVSTPPCPRVDPARGVIRIRANTGSSIYHSLQVSYDHRSSRGISAGVHFTESAFIDNGSEIVNPSTSEVATPQDPFNRDAGERARSTYDRPHRLTGNLVYELPLMKNGRGILSRVASGLRVGTQATFQSGSPFTVLNGADPGNVLLGSLVGSAIRPNFAPGVNASDLQNSSISEIRRRVIEAGSPSIFFRSLTTNGGPTAAAPIGNVPRNLLRSDGIIGIDMNIVKTFKIMQGQTLQFRADIFNLPNTRNFGIPNATANTTAFNFLNEGATDGGNRRIFVSLRYGF